MKINSDNIAISESRLLDCKLPLNDLNLPNLVQQNYSSIEIGAGGTLMYVWNHP